MRGYARWVEFHDVDWQATEPVVCAVESIHREVKFAGRDESGVASELFDNWWRGAAHLHPDLSADELASLLLDGYDAEQEGGR